MTNKLCDHASVGVIARDSDGRVLLTKKLEELSVWCCPNGHCDGKSYGSAAFKCFEEATGLKIFGSPRSVGLKKPIRDNLCERRGEWHEWMVYQVDWIGELDPNSNAAWFMPEEAKKLNLEAVWYEFLRELNII